MVQEPTFCKSLGWGFRLQNFLARAILSSFWNLMTWVEGILNSNPWTAEFLKDPNSSQPLSPVNILTMKSKIVSRASCIEHFANKFRSCWKEQYLQSLQEYQKWESKKMNFRVGNIAIVYQANVSRSYIPMAREIGVTMVSRGWFKLCYLKSSIEDGTILLSQIASILSSITNYLLKEHVLMIFEKLGAVLETSVRILEEEWKLRNCNDCNENQNNRSSEIFNNQSKAFACII